VTEFEGLEPGRYIVVDGIAVKQHAKKTRSNRGLVIEGVATKYDTILYHDSFGPGRYINIQPGAFDISLKYEAPVQLWLNHDSKLAMPGCRVELFDGEEALHFRAHLDDSECAFHAHDLVASGLYTQVSLGWHSSKTILHEIERKQLTYIVAGTLTELSIVPKGAVPSTHCQVSRLADIGTLEHDSKSLRFKSDNTAATFSRALKRLESEL
jgi:HK97 family phage prohead protease